MKATILKIKKQRSKYGGEFYYLFFKGEDGKSYKSCISSNYGNFIYWADKLEEGIVLDNLKIKNETKNLIDADCKPIKVNNEK